MLQKANDVLFYAVKGISDVILADGTINLDFADVRTTMSESGMALMGTGVAAGENRAREAAQRAINSPLLEDVSLESAKAVLYNITASMDISTDEIAEIGDIIADATPEDTNIIFGVVYDENIGDELRLTVIATGIDPSAAVVPPVPEPVKSSSVTSSPARRPRPRPAPWKRRRPLPTSSPARAPCASAVTGSPRTPIRRGGTVPIQPRTSSRNRPTCAQAPRWASSPCPGASTTLVMRTSPTVKKTSRFPRSSAPRPTRPCGGPLGHERMKFQGSPLRP